MCVCMHWLVKMSLDHSLCNRSAQSKSELKKDYFFFADENIVELLQGEKKNPKQNGKKKTLKLLRTCLHKLLDTLLFKLS